MRKWTISILIIGVILFAGIIVFQGDKEATLVEDLKGKDKVVEEFKPYMAEDNQEDMNNLLKHIGFSEEVLSKFKIEVPEEAVTLWAEGIISGNGVLQYAIMDKNLKQEFKSYLESKNNLSWDTRINDFTIESFDIIEELEVSEKIKIYIVKFNYEDKNGVKRENYNKITVVNENDNWVISLIR